MPQINQIILLSYKYFLSRISATSHIHLKSPPTWSHWSKHLNGAGFLACIELNRSPDSSRAVLIYCSDGPGISFELWDNVSFPFLTALVNNLNTCLEFTKNNIFTTFLVSWKVRNAGSESHKLLCSIFKISFWLRWDFGLRRLNKNGFL